MTAEELAAKAAKEAAAAEAAKAAKEAELDAIAKRVAHQIMDAAKGNRDPENVITGPAPTPAKSGVVVGDRADKGQGLQLVRFIKAKAVARIDGGTVEGILKRDGHTDMLRALSQGEFTAGGSLVHPEFAADFLELLRNTTVIRQAGPNIIQMGASLTFDGQSSAATASYGGEASIASPSQPATNQPLVLSEKKLTALVPLTNDLLRNKSVGAETLVRNDLLAVIGLTEDTAFLYGTGSQYQPKGLKNQLKSTHKYAMTALTTAGVPTHAECKKELNKAIKMLRKANAPMRKLAWLMGPSAFTAILDAVGPGGVGSNALEVEYNARGTFNGYPVFVTNQIPETSSADLFLLDMSEVIVGESMGLEMEVFPNGAYLSGGSVVSGISTDSTVIRAITKHDIGMRHDVSGICVTGVTWGLA